MLLWQLVVEAAKKEKIDRDQTRAAAWVGRHVMRFEGPDGGWLEQPVDWAYEWPIWQDRMHALLWLARRRTRSRTPQDDRMPLFVDQALDETVGKTRNAIITDRFSDARPVIRLTNQSGELAACNTGGPFDDLTAFWQFVFVTFLQPDAFPSLGSRCQNCGESLPPTRKGKRSRKAKVCDRCRQKLWAQANAERRREINREAKQAERQRMAKKAS